MSRNDASLPARTDGGEAAADDEAEATLELAAIVAAIRLQEWSGAAGSMEMETKTQGGTREAGRDLQHNNNHNEAYMSRGLDGAARLNALVEQPQRLGRVRQRLLLVDPADHSGPLTIARCLSAVWLLSLSLVRV